MIRAHLHLHILIYQYKHRSRCSFIPICYSCFHRSSSSVEDLEKRLGEASVCSLLAHLMIWMRWHFSFAKSEKKQTEVTDQTRLHDSRVQPSHQHEAVSCRASTKLTTVRPKPAWKSAFLRTIGSSRRAHSGSDAAQRPVFKTRAQRSGVKTLQGENDLEFTSSEFQLHKSSLWKTESTFNKSPKNITRKTIAPR